MEFPTTDLVPHYKVQFFDEITLSWKDIQKTHSAIENAIASAKKLKQKKTRIMRILGKVREPIETFEN